MGDNGTAAGHVQVPEADRAVALAKLRAMGIDTAAAPDPLIDLAQIGQLAGVQKNTVEIWRQRSRDSYRGKGRLVIPFPAPDVTVPKATTGFLDKPKWHAISTVLVWLIQMRKWHPESEAA